MEFNIKNFIQIFSMIPSVILCIFFILLSCFNGDIKAFIFLLGVAIAFLFNKGVSKLIGTPTQIGRNPLYCDAFNIPMFESQYVNPYSTSLFLGFTLLYMTLPMFFYNNYINPTLIITLFSLILLNGKTSTDYSCTTWGGIGMGVLVGGICGWIWFMMLLSMGAGEQLYFGEVMSNKATCSSKKQSFKCTMRKKNLY